MMNRPMMMRKIRNVDTYLANVTSLQQPIKLRTLKIHNVNQCCNFLPKEDWLRIPEDVRAKLVNNKETQTTENKHLVIC
jgi:hypothetical protein